MSKESVRRLLARDSRKFADADMGVRVGKIKDYCKLVRDNIPDIIAEDGGKASFRTLTVEEAQHELRRKLSEEVREYLAAPSMEELADVVAVAVELAQVRLELNNKTARSFHPASGLGVLVDLMAQKESRAGGFRKRIYLLWVEEQIEKERIGL